MVISKKKLPDGTQWEVFSTTMTEKRPITYNTGRRGKDGQFVTDMELSTYIVKRFSLSKTVGGECETVWEREEIFPENLGMPTSGMTPHYGTIVWDVAESNNVVFVLCSQHGRLRVDIQRENDIGQWAQTGTFPCGDIVSVYFSGRLRCSSAGVRVATCQWNKPDARDRKHKVFEIPADGLRVCHPQDMDEADEKP